MVPDISGESVIDEADYEPMKTAVGKIAIIAATYDPNRGSAGKGAFESRTINATAFSEQLRTNFKLKLSPEELGAVLCRYDKGQTGEIDCGAFLIEFMRLGRIERAQQTKLKREKEQQEESAKERWADSTVARFTNAAQAMLAPPKASDLQSGLGKLRKVSAVSSSGGGHRSGAVSSFEGDHLLVHRDTAGFVPGVRMTPTVFKEQMRRNLNVKVTPGELAALVLHFDKDGDGLVSCSEFMREFKRMGREQRKRQLARKNRRNRDITRRNQEREERTMNRLSDSFRQELVVGGNKSLAKALDKVAAVAGTYDPAGPVNLLAAFQGSFVGAAVLKEQLRLHFRIKLTPKELGALVQRFDSAKNGTVNCGMFLNEFFRIGRAARSRSEQQRKALNKAVTGRREMREKKAADGYIKHHQAKVVMPANFPSGFTVDSNMSMSVSTGSIGGAMDDSVRAIGTSPSGGDLSIISTGTAKGASTSISSMRSRTGGMPRPRTTGSRQTKLMGSLGGFNQPAYDFFEEIPKLLETQKMGCNQSSRKEAGGSMRIADSASRTEEMAPEQIKLDVQAQNEEQVDQKASLSPKPSSPVGTITDGTDSAIESPSTNRQSLSPRSQQQWQATKDRKRLAEVEQAMHELEQEKTRRAAEKCRLEKQLQEAEAAVAARSQAQRQQQLLPDEQAKAAEVGTDDEALRQKQAQREAERRARLLQAQARAQAKAVAEAQAKAEAEEASRRQNALPRFACVVKAIGVRLLPDVKAAKTGAAVRKGDIVRVKCQRNSPADNKPWGQTYLELADGRGWVFDTKPGSCDKIMTRVATPPTVAAVDEAETGSLVNRSQSQAARKSDKPVQLVQLERYSADLDSIEAQLQEAESIIAPSERSSAQQEAARARSSLAQLLGTVERLQCTKIDAVQIGAMIDTESVSGASQKEMKARLQQKQQARMERKKLTQRCEAIDARIRAAAAKLDS